jgi:hypothetical protein
MHIDSIESGDNVVEGPEISIHGPSLIIRSDNEENPVKVIPVKGSLEEELDR